MKKNPYTHLRTMIDDESRHDELNDGIYCATRSLEIPDGGRLGIPMSWHSDGAIDYLSSNPTIGFKRPGYTASLDALIPLWPEGWSWTLVYENGKQMCDAQKGVTFIAGNGKTTALAMLDCLLQVLEYEFNGRNHTNDI